MTEQTMIHGHLAAGFEPVRTAFARNFADPGEVGASCAVYVDGELVVDLWGGTADQAAGRPWDRDSICLVYSVTKGAAALGVHLLVQRGLVDLDAPVARYWPEFAAAGKSAITVRMLLSHRAGLPLIDPPLTREELLSGDAVAPRLAASAPLWEPGSRHGYHALTFGWLAGELVRRVTGSTIGEFFAEEVAAPLGLAFWIGLPERQRGRLAPLVNGAPPSPADLAELDDPGQRDTVAQIMAAMTDPSTVLFRALTTNGVLPAPDAGTWNDSAILAAAIPAANGVTNARSLARMYAACVSRVDGVRLLEPHTVAAATVEHSSGRDEVLFAPTRFGAGYMLHSAGSTMLGEDSFGHTGAGGALGFADSAAKVGFGYVQNLIGRGLTADSRAARIVSALAQCLETTNTHRR